MDKVVTLSSKQAWQMLQDNPKAILVDVRSDMEYLFVGHPTGAVHIPWIDYPEWQINPNFAAELRKTILGGICHGASNEGVPVILICRSGKRSLEAGDSLISEGFCDVYNIEDGFEGELDKEHHRGTHGGWRSEGLPWQQC